MGQRLELPLATCPELRAPVLLAAFAGWGDGAMAGTNALQYLLSKHQAQRLGGFDPDEIYVYTTTRPVTLRRENGERELVWPSLELYACPLPAGKQDALLLLGPEPNLRWRGCARAILDAAIRCKARVVIVLGSYWDRVTHLGRPLLTARAADHITRDALIALRLPESGYQGPTGFTSALLEACAQRGLPAAGISARAPHYAQGIAHPKLALALLETVQRLLGLRFDLAELEGASREYERLLTQRLQQEPRLWRYVQQLAAEQGQAGEVDDLARGPWQKIVAASPTTEQPAPAAESDLPSGQELVEAVEEFLRRSGRER
ncbi:MAG TPA: PAC2 family protein [Chloroflexota bacterium]|jgi:proteasome assembly chaperone (PAC2) family protein|nr:PAC2 family protein [Chloroflexota bacterium]